jgi:phosphodiesterase/alkaline phosphatase D-like protein
MGDLSSGAFDDLRGCLKKVSGAAAKYGSARLKERSKCGKKFLAGKIDGTCPDEKGIAKLDKARLKLAGQIDKSCPVSTGIGLAAFAPGFPCDLFEDSTFDRDGMTNDNLIPLKDRYSRCLVTASAGTGDMGADTGYPLSDSDPFFLGVAAGDSTDTAFMVWTRTSGAGDVTLEVATDEAFTAIVDMQVLAQDAAADDTVKTEVTGLTAATQYYYRFSQGGETSRVGRIKTALAPAATTPFTFAFTGDSNAYFKPFSVLEQITAADPDTFLYIGDLIYGDDERSGTGIATVRTEYHDKYEENRNDRALRDLLANVGTYSMWDDHEVTNDFWGTDAGIAAQMAEGNQALRDYMPIRENGGDAMQLYRSFAWGDVAEFFLIDPRQYRDSQAYITEPACIEGVCSGDPEEACHSQSVCDGLVGGGTCHKGTCSDTGDICSSVADCDLIQLGQDCDENDPAALPPGPCIGELGDPGRTYLGATQLAWLKDGLTNSTATFKFIMNGPLITQLLFVPYDRWEGYAAERTDLLDHIENGAIDNVIFLSTDIHAAILNDDVRAGAGVREFVAGAIGMDPIVRELPASIAPLVPTLPSLFTSISYFDIDRFTVAIADVSQTELTMRWLDNSGQVLTEVTVPAL